MSFLLKLRRLTPTSEFGNILATGLRKKPDGLEGTCRSVNEKVQVNFPNINSLV